MKNNLFSNLKNLNQHFCQLFIAPCNHSACSICWESWLKRSKTCPSCRKPTTKETLAKAVYHKASKKIPTLTQMCASDDDEVDSEGELEIISTK